MRIVVTGQNGQVATALAERGAGRGHEIVLLGRPALDLAANVGAIGAALAASRADVIVSAAAYTAVDQAEAERDLVFAVNARGAEAVAVAASRLDVPLVHLSTDYVFDGAKSSPYLESDPTRPNSVYGASKLAGERLVLAAQPDCVVLRTAWVFSPFGGNFVKTMLRLAADRAEVGVVHDQEGNPTSAFDVADAIVDIASNLLADRDPLLRGTFHMTSSTEANWASFAAEIFARSAARGGPAARVRAITTAEYPTPAPRPRNSRLDCSLLATRHNVVLRPWQSALEHVIARLIDDSEQNGA